MQPRTPSRLPFLVLTAGLVLLGGWSYQALRVADSLYDGVLQAQSSVSPTVEKAVIGSKKVLVPSWDMFKTGQLWELVSKTNPLPHDYVPHGLVNIPISHGDANSRMKVSSTISGHLKGLVVAAGKAGYPLMASSAYRSISDQQTLYASFVNKYGVGFAKEYVADPGTSEHHTGLAVDLSTKSPECSTDSNACSLSNEAASWLEGHAASYGFIQRYPEGDAPITGISFEPWHYRYVGVTLAKAMQGSSLTLDEVITQLAPGYAK